MGYYVKDPEAVLDYHSDWTAWLDGDVITASTWTADPGITIETDPPHAATHDDTTTTVWLSGGTPGTVYSVTNHITTAAGREDDRTKIIDCRHR